MEFATSPLGKIALECKLVYKIKYDVDRTIERHKVWLVIFGNHLVEGINYNETFATVGYIVAVHCILTIAVSSSWGSYKWMCTILFFTVT